MYCELPIFESILRFSVRSYRLFFSWQNVLIADLSSALHRNPGGVRFGSAEIYDVLDTCFSGPVSISNNHGIQRIVDSLVVGQMTEDKKDERVVLFVKLDQGENLTQETVLAIKQEIRVRRSARHVPSSVSHLNVFRYPTPPYQGPSKRVDGLDTLQRGVCRRRRHGIRPVAPRRGFFERIWLTSPYCFSLVLCFRFSHGVG